MVWPLIAKRKSSSSGNRAHTILYTTTRTATTLETSIVWPDIRPEMGQGLSHVCTFAVLPSDMLHCEISRYVDTDYGPCRIVAMNRSQCTITLERTFAQVADHVTAEAYRNLSRSFYADFFSSTPR